jgi:hypothetical protein
MNLKTKGVHLLAIVLLILTGSCSDKVKDTITYTANLPVYMTRAEFIKSVKTGSKLDLIKPGKIFLRGNYILINELYKGIHVINNTNPASPQNVAFITIPGNVDIAVRGNTLYADSFTDLVALDISDPTKATEVGRIENAFPNVMPPTENNLSVKNLDATKGVVVGWTQEKFTEDLNPNPTNPISWDLIGFQGLSSSTYYAKTDNSWASISLSSSISGQSVVAGSMARFAVYNDMLYALTNTQMKVFSISNAQPVQVNSTWSSWQAETLFVSGQLMFAGTRQGLVIFSLANPSLPTQISTYSHLYSCDPVVVEGKYAYYTMHSGNACGQSASGMGVVDISDPTMPVEVSFYTLNNPLGLGIDNGILFVGNGTNGLNVYDASNPRTIALNRLASFTNIMAYDVIPYNKILIVIGAGGLMQYDYTDITNIKLLSVIATVTGIM